MSITGLTLVVTAWRVTSFLSLSCRVSSLIPEEQRLPSEGGDVNLDGESEGSSFTHSGPFHQSLWLRISPGRIRAIQHRQGFLLH